MVRFRLSFQRAKKECRKRPNPGPLRADYAGGGSDFPQKDKNASSPQKGMIDDDMGKYGESPLPRFPRRWTGFTRRSLAAAVRAAIERKRTPRRSGVKGRERAGH